MAYLLTWSGTLLCRHRHSGALLHRAIAPDMGDLEPIVLDLPTEQLQPGFGHHLRATLPDLPASASGMLQRFRPQWAEDQRTITLQHDDAFLTAAPHDDGISMVPGAPGGWQTFLPLSAADLDALRTILAASWLVRSSGELVERPTLGALFHLHVGGLAVDLRYQLPFDHAHWPNRLTLLRDGWRIDQICRYQPLVYYSAFGSPDHLEQFAVSVRSLIEFGRYQGPILALTDQTPAGMAGYLAPEDLARVALLQFKPHDRPGFMAARYLILDWAEGWTFQPLLYVDADTVFDDDVAPLLRTVATSDHIAAPLELTSTMAETAGAGASLFQRDFCSPGFMAGFNTGTLGIPNLRAHAETLRLIRRIIANHGIMHGRATLPWADQEVANYVAFRLMPFDTGPISRFVRFAGADVDTRGRRGLVHFWPVPGAAERARVMRDYLERLRAG